MRLLIREDSKDMVELFSTYFKNHGANDKAAGLLTALAITFVLVLVCFIIHIILKKIILRLVTKIIRNNRLNWDDALLNHRLFQRAILIVPCIIFYSAASVYEKLELVEVIRRIASTYVLIILLFVISSILDTIDEIYRAKPV